jgi:hypothetical protein
MHVCHTSYFTSYFMLQTFYFVISRGGTEGTEPTPTKRHSMPVLPAWNLPGLAIERLCGWNQYNVRWS